MSIQDKDRMTAIHEAGHAVVQLRECPTDLIGHLTIEPADGKLGAVLSETTAENPHQAAKAIMVLCGGYAAMRAAGWDEQAALLGADQDFETAAALIDAWGLEDIEHWKAKTVDLLSVPHNLRAVEQVAALALQHRRLDGDVLQTAVEYTDGELSEQEWSFFLQFRSMAVNKASS